ncbi:peptidase inhibitor family I36 protein [Kibdelosporangium aridum]|uniref:peptidase inhibitor family I36 protein n=1 Tax=Kibdelosporangium aridum TaxID=2030 RepID=UPI0035EBBDBA
MRGDAGMNAVSLLEQSGKEFSRKVVKIVRWLKSACVTAGLILASVVTAPGTAQADPSVVQGSVPDSGFGNCPAGWFCAWEHEDALGRWFQTQRAQPNLMNPIAGFVFGDQITAVWNRTNVDWCAYHFADYRGPALTIEPGAWSANLDENPGGWGDTIRSLRPRPANRDCELPD